MLTIHQYQSSYQNLINELIFEIASEFENPIFNGSKPRLPNLDQCWVAFHKTQLIGTIGLIKVNNEFVVLKNMFVKKKFRGSEFGISNILLEKAIDWCLVNKIKSIYLGTMTQFKAAHKFYEKNGFVEISRDQLPIDFIDNPIDDVFYNRLLNGDIQE